MSAHQWLQTHSPIKKILNKVRDSCQTYINYYKSHAMTTHYGRIGDTSMNNSENHDMDANDYQADINDLENIEPNHQAGLRNLTCEIEQLLQTIKANDNDPMDAISHLEHKLNQLAITLCPPMPAEPIGEVLNKYTNTLCNAQKKTSLESSLLQDITILNGNDSSQLEDWLTAIETASDLTGKSRTKLAQAKSKGLIRTLISEALTSNKTWEDIKDSLHLKFVIWTFTHPSVVSWKSNKKKKNPQQLIYIALKGKLADANLIMMQQLSEFS